MSRLRTQLASTLLATSAVFAASRGCMSREGCLAGDGGTCLPPTPCLALHYTCDAPSLELGRVQSARDRSPGLDALAARGDWVLGNDRFRAVFDDVGAPHYLAPSGGNLLDLVPRDHGASPATTSSTSRRSGSYRACRR